MSVELLDSVQFWSAARSTFGSRSRFSLDYMYMESDLLKEGEHNSFL